MQPLFLCAFSANCFPDSSAEILRLIDSKKLCELSHKASLCESVQDMAMERHKYSPSEISLIYSIQLYIVRVGAQ